MAVQRIGFLESNFEKILVCAAGAGLLGVIAWQVVETPQVMVDKKSVTLDRALPELVSMANRVKADLVAKEPKLPEVPALNIKAEFASKRAEPLVPKAPALAWNLAGLTGVKAGEGGISTVVGTNVRIPNLPAPARPVVGTFLSTIDPQEVTNVPGLAALVTGNAGAVGATGPFDKASVTIETTFSGVSLRDEMARVENAAKPEDQLKPVPRGWWAGTEIVSVEVGRQRQLPDGTWGEDSIVSPMPGRVNLNEMIKRTDLDIAEIIRAAREQREEILRPEFYQRATVAGHLVGEEWYPPSQAEAIEAKGDQAKILQRELNELQKKATGLERVIAGLGATPGGGNRPPPGPGGGRGGSGRGNPAPAPNAGQDELRRREGELAALRTQMATKDTELRALGIRTGVRAPLPEDPQFKDLTETLRDGAIQVWAHDLEAKRGATYRYRVRVGVSNPLFGQQRELKQQDAEIARRYALFTAVSEWSQPVLVDPEVYYFITGASTKTGLTTVPNASAEMFMFSAGYWRRARVAMEPGDALAGRVQTLDWNKVNTTSTAPDPNAPARLPTTPGGITPPSGPQVPPPGGRSPTPPGQGQTPSPAGAGGAEKVEPLATQEVLISKDVYLLDVPTAPEARTGVGSSATTKTVQVFLRDTDGKVVIRTPGADRNTPAYQRLDQSATAGEAFTKNPTGAAASTPRDPRRNPDPSPPLVPMPVAPGGGSG